EGTVRRLIRAVLEARPDNAEVKRFRAQHGRLCEAPEAQADTIQAGVRDLTHLLQLLADRRVEAVIIRFRTDFQATREQITTLDRYKALHDGLHTLQFRLYRQVAGSAELLLTRPQAAAAELDGYAEDIAQEVQRARAYARGLRESAAEEDWLSRLEGVARDLRSGPGQPDGARGRQAGSEFSRGLAGPASPINSLLTRAAGEVPLEALTGDLRTVDEALARADVPREGVPLADGFRRGLKALEEFRPRFRGLLQEHLRWQELDNNLRVAEADADSA